MNKNDFDAFVGMLDAGAGLYGKVMTPVQKAMYFRILNPYPLEIIKAAFDAHASDSERGRFMPLPADLIGQIENNIEQNDGRPSPEQAWSTAVEALDEAKTIVWTTETAQAWAEVGCALMEAGDRFNASRGFIDLYRKLVEKARKGGLKARWEVSQGHDKDLRKQAVESAYRANLITRETVMQLLPRHNDDTGPIVAAIAGNVVKMIGTDKPLPAVVGVQDASQRLRGLIADVLKKTEDPLKEKPKPSAENNIRIVNEAIEMGVIRDMKDIDHWMTLARNRDDVSRLQVMMLEKRNGKA